MGLRRCRGIGRPGGVGGVAAGFFGLQPDNSDYHNDWAAKLSGSSNAYNFPYSDRFAPVTATLDPAVVDTLEIDIGGDVVPEPASLALLSLARVGLLRRRRNAR